MKKLFVMLCVLTLISGMMGTADVYAFNFGTATNITIWDKEDGGYGTKEDEEVEPGMQWDQKWDMEAFLRDGKELAMVGGFDFENGETGNGMLFEHGDIFVDVDMPGNAQYGDDTYGSSSSSYSGNNPVQDTFGYDYVLDLDFTNKTYNVFDLNQQEGAAPVTLESVYYGANRAANPWRYLSGAKKLNMNPLGFTYLSGLLSAQAGGFAGSGPSHNAVILDLSNLEPLGINLVGPGGKATYHSTMQCGNDNLMGYHDPTAAPEPTTLLLLGCGLIGVFAVGRKRFRK